METKTILSAVGGGIVALALGFFLMGVGQDGRDGRNGVNGVGSVVGPDVYTSMYLEGGATVGSSCFSTSTTGTLTATQLLNNSCIYITAGGAGQGVLSLTLPASTTMGAMLPTTGGCREWFIDASDVAAATTTTIVAGTGWDLVGLDATGAGTGADVIDGAEFGKLVACKQKDGDVVGYVQEYLAAD